MRRVRSRFAKDTEYLFMQEKYIIDNYWNKSNQEENISDKEKKLIKSFAKEVKVILLRWIWQDAMTVLSLLWN
ncbi:MAG: hypothetical protein V8S08_03390 [Lachnoclostridium sp.]